MIKNHRIFSICLIVGVTGLSQGCQSLKLPFAPSTAATPSPVSTSQPDQSRSEPVATITASQASVEPTPLPQPDAEVAPIVSAPPDLPTDVTDNTTTAQVATSATQVNDAELVDAEIHLEVEQALAQESTQTTTPDIWARLQQGMRMEPVTNKRVKAQLDWFQNHPDYLTRAMERARPILPFILDVLEEQDLPSEFALLPIVESAYQTFAYSHGRASGMWQIIPSTGRFLGLKQNWWYDGRRDLIESTHAATRYLKILGEQFDNDWELALAAYNAGPGKIRSAIRHNRKKGKPTHFWELTRIRRETRDYVPKLLALKTLFSDPETYDLELIPIEDQPAYEIVELDSQIDLALAAEMAGISTEELYHLNPAFNRWATAPNGPHRLLLPRGVADDFRKELADMPREKRINWVRHRIREGETLSHIALKYNTTTTLVKKLNKIRGSQIRAGKHLLIPTATRSLADYSLSKKQRLNKIQNTPRKGEKMIHQVKSGESIWLIANRYGVGTRQLAKWNGMAPTDTLRVGRELVVWKQKPVSEARLRKVSLSESDPRKRLHALRYTVRKGDSLSLIADRFNVRVADLKKWNRIGKYLQPGQKLKLWVDITRQSS